jgi:hypothetical protein
MMLQNLLSKSANHIDNLERPISDLEPLLPLDIRAWLVAFPVDC